MAGGEKKRHRGLWIALAVVVVLLIPVAVIAIPILAHQNSGESGQIEAESAWPTEVMATGADGRERLFTVSSPDSAVPLDTSALTPGDRIVVTGAGYDASQGIYVAICRIPDDAATKPGPCIGGVPDQAAEEVDEGTVQYAPSNWINDAFAWKLFGSRSYDNEADGTFTAYLEVGDPVGDGLDCTVDACGIFTRNDHTAMNDRVQDLYVPVGFAAAASAG